MAETLLIGAQSLSLADLRRAMAGPVRVELTEDAVDASLPKPVLTP